MELSEENLPSQFRNILVGVEEDVAEIRSSVNSLTDINKWVSEFSKNTNSCWITRDSNPEETKKLLCRKTFVCQHSSYKKGSGKKSIKNCDCRAMIKFSVKITSATTRRNDKFVQEGLPARILINLNHSHTLNTAAALSHLKPDMGTKKLFENYFTNGLGVSEAMTFHESTLEDGPNTEEILANARVNPKRRTVIHWHSEWRKRNFGTRTGKDVFEVMAQKQANYKEKGIKISFEKDPPTIVVVTPLMKRAHMLPGAKDIVFVDSTASCNAENNSVTFLLTPCSAGAVPLGIIITSGQTVKDYVAGFTLLNKSVDTRFGGEGFPKNFMTDDSAAEREAIKVVWEDSNRLLCHFHISQAVWRWLRKKEHCIDEKDRQSLYRSFKTVMMATNNEEANTQFDTAINSENVLKYPNFKKYFLKYWERKEEWVLAFRDESTHNNNTNNYCEAGVRLFKDLVLGRSRAYNVVALVDYISVLLEEYYSKRLRRFAHDRCNSPRLALNHALVKAAYLEKAMIESVGTGKFKVPSQEQTEVYYLVDTVMGTCSCAVGNFGGFCKHQAAIFFYYQEISPSTPGVTAAARHEIALLAFGEAAKPKEFYQDLQQPDQLENTTPSQEPTSTILPQEVEDITSEPILPKDNDEVTEESFKAFMEAVMNCHKKFGTSNTVVERITKRLANISTRTAWDSFLSSSGIFQGSCSRRKISVQPTAISRRRAGVTRGSKRIPAGRPPKGEKAAKKRKRNLPENVKNFDNVKPH